jgi:hypothetical protein
MKEMATQITKFIIEERGPDSLVNALSDPLWFQAFNNIIGMDWDSSGSTTVVLSLLKDISWNNDLGFIVFGGKGSNMINIKNEWAIMERRLNNIHKEDIIKFSKLSARADSAFLQDGYDIYIHSVIVSLESKNMITVQQGMNLNSLMARRYHINKFNIENPHSGIIGSKEKVVIDATSINSRRARKVFIDIISEGERKFQSNLIQAYNVITGKKTLDYFIDGNNKNNSIINYYYPIKPSSRLIDTVKELSKYKPSNDLELALAPRVGPSLIRALALISDVIYSTPISNQDPVNLSLDPFGYSYTIGGKDGIPFPFDAKTALEAIEFLRNALEEAKIGDKIKKRSLMNLNSFIKKIKISNMK